VRRGAVVILVVVLLAAVALIVAELATSAGQRTVTIANPCRVRAPFPGSGIDATVQRVVLDALDRAACQLHTTREELVLSLRPAKGKKPRWDEHTLDTALRAGLVSSVDQAEHRGDIPAFLAPLIRNAVAKAPISKIIEGSVSLSDLFG
jgi:hypothetical protein